MTAPLLQNKKYTLSEYFELLKNSPHQRYEYFDRMIHAMAGTTLEHNSIKQNCVYLLRKKKKCRVYDENVQLQIESLDSYFFPDILFICGEVNTKSYQVDNPVLIIEVLSNSTERYDKKRKFLYYQRIPTLRNYLLVSQNEPCVEMYYREDEGGWFYTMFEDINEVVSIPALSIKMKLKEIYYRIVFDSTNLT